MSNAINDIVTDPQIMECPHCSGKFAIVPRGGSESYRCLRCNAPMAQRAGAGRRKNYCPSCEAIAEKELARIRQRNYRAAK